MLFVSYFVDAEGEAVMFYRK